MQPGNPVVGGVALRRAAIQSPDYVHGVSGWAINQDGTAEFNAVELNGGPFTVVGTLQTLAVQVSAGVPSIDYWMNSNPSDAGGIVPQGDGSLAIYSIDWGGGERQELILGQSLVLLGANNGTDAYIQIEENGAHTIYINLNNSIPAYLQCDVQNGFGHIGVGGEPWHDFALENSWTSGSPDGFNNPGYRMNALGNVELRGLGLAGTKANGTVVANLPANYRPSVVRHVITSADAGVSPFCCILEIETTGDIKIFGLGTGGVLGFDGVQFSI